MSIIPSRVYKRSPVSNFLFISLILVAFVKPYGSLKRAVIIWQNFVVHNSACASSANACGKQKNEKKLHRVIQLKAQIIAHSFVSRTERDR